MPANQTRPNYLGLLLLLAILAFYVFNVVSPSGYAYFRPLSMIAAIGAVVLFLGGWRLVQYTWLPIVFLVFAVPLPRRYYVGLTMPMRQIAASVATALLNLLHGVDATASGVVIDIVYKGHRLEPPLDVAEACSGMRLMMAFLALGVAMAYLHYRPMWQRVVLLLSTVPIAMLCNVIRVTVTGFIYVLAEPRVHAGDLPRYARSGHAAACLCLLRPARDVHGEPVHRGGRRLRRRQRDCEEAEREMKRTGDNKAAYLQPAFLLCVAVLGLAGAGMSVAKKQLGLYMKKEPLPSEEAAQRDGRGEAGPVPRGGQLQHRERGHTEVPRDGGLHPVGPGRPPRPRRQSRTKRVAVHHVLQASGSRAARAGGMLHGRRLSAGSPRTGSPSSSAQQGDARSIPGRYLLFGASAGNVLQGGGQFPVLYLFRVNGEYAGSRDDARMALNKNIFGKHAYFCKIELVFNQGYVAPAKAAATEASEKLLSVILPILEQEHWPD